MLTTTADARAGGGFSAGSRGSRTFSAPPSTSTAPSVSPMQRSVTQPTRPGTVGAAPAAGGFFSRPGLLGGLAAGFLGAGLFGMLFGHGLFGGLGGFASFFGLILQIGLVLIIGRFLWNMWQRRQQQPAYAGAPNANASMLHDVGGSGFGAASGGGTPSANIEITPADYDVFERLLGEIQAAYSNEDLNGLRQHLTPEMVSYFSEQLSENVSRGVVNKVSDVKLLQGDLAEAWRENGVDYASVAMRFSPGRPHARSRERPAGRRQRNPGGGHRGVDLHAGGRRPLAALRHSADLSICSIRCLRGGAERRPFCLTRS